MVINQKRLSIFLISKLKKLEKDQKVHYFLNEESIQENEG
jgi:Fe-S cluster biosynthesis and repair protein YggX